MNIQCCTESDHFYPIPASPFSLGMSETISQSLLLVGVSHAPTESMDWPLWQSRLTGRGKRPQALQSYKLEQKEGLMSVTSLGQRGLPIWQALVELGLSSPMAPKYIVRLGQNHPKTAGTYTLAAVSPDFVPLSIYIWLWTTKLNDLTSHEQNPTFPNFPKTKTSCFPTPRRQVIFYPALPSAAARCDHAHAAPRPR